MIILDIMLPYRSGDIILSDVRKKFTIPVIIISAKETTQNKIDLLRLGADDYITKPFDMEEVLARIESNLRRVQFQNSQTECLQYNNLTLDLEKNTAFLNGIELSLTAKEFGILELLMKYPDKVFSKSNLFQSVWDTAKSLTKEYKQTLALDHINLQIKKGKIYGFIGQNGAGKTTFLRLVTGLAFPTSGTLSLWGNSGTEELQKQRKRIGSMIETPALFPSMTAYQNMEVQRIQRGIPDKSVIKRTLDMVGLQDTGKKSVRNFSLGMRQRLGIAIALLNTPELLILDEPINGLDPAGIVEIRNLLKILNKEYGMTILVSSHILEELYQTASEFILIDHGKIIEEISDYELNERCKRHIAIKTTDVQKTVLVLEENLHTDNFKLMPDGIIRLYDYLNDLETVASALAESHILVTGLSVSGDTLEDYFLSKIGGTKDVKSPKN